MDKENKVTVTKIYINDSPTYIKVIWDRLALQFRLFEENLSWFGTLTTDDIQELSAKSLECDETYLENIKNALNSSNSMYIFEFKKDSNEFIIKKKFNNAIRKYCIIKLAKDESINKDHLIDYFLNKQNLLTKDIKETLESRTRLKIELENCKRNWEEDVKLKQNFEKDLYGKFIQLLNTKKRRIQVLEKHIEYNKCKPQLVYSEDEYDHEGF